MKYYEALLPDQTQASVISARYIDINNCLSSLGWSQFGRGSDDYYMTKTAYDSSYNYTLYLCNYTGGNLGHVDKGYIRGVVSISAEGPIMWNDPKDLTLSVKKGDERIFISNPNEDLSQYDEIEGLSVCLGSSHFIIKLHNEQSGTVTVSTAMALYEDILPDKEQATIISLKRNDIKSKLQVFGGDRFLSGSYITKTAYDNSEYNYAIYFSDSYSSYGSLTTSSGGYIRGVITLHE